MDKTGAIEETEPNARTSGLNMAISILFSLENGNFGPFVSSKKILCTNRSSLFCIQSGEISSQKRH
jgi:hypothetical protein